MDHRKPLTVTSSWTESLELATATVSLFAMLFGIVWYMGASAEAHWISPPLLWHHNAVGKPTDFWWFQGACATLLYLGAGIAFFWSFMRILARHQTKEKQRIADQVVAEAQWDKLYESFFTSPRPPALSSVEMETHQLPVATPKRRTRRPGRRKAARAA